MTRQRSGSHATKKNPKSSGRVASKKPSKSIEIAPTSNRQDIYGLLLIALGVTLAFPVYFGWSGGAAGESVITGVRTLVGVVTALLPFVLVVAGFILLLKPILPAFKPLRLGAILGIFAVTLLWAAGTFGLGGKDRLHLWDLDEVRERGGLLGDFLLWVSSSLLGGVAAHVLALTLLIAAAILLTGASISSIVANTGRGLSSTKDRISQASTSFSEQREQRLAQRRHLQQTPVRSIDRTIRLTTAAPKRSVWAEPELQPERRERMNGPESITAETAIVEAVAAIPVQKTEEPRLDGSDRFPELYEGDEDSILNRRPEKSISSERVKVENDTSQSTIADESHSADFPDENFAGLEESTAVTNEIPVVEQQPAPLAPVVELKPRSLPVRASSDEEEERFPLGVQTALQFESDEFELPDPQVLKRSTEEQLRPDTAGLQETGDSLVEALSHFNIEAKIHGTVVGPHITRYELALAPGTKMSKVAQLKDDLAYALAATDIRILAPIPGKRAVGVEVPNKRRRVVHLGDVYGPIPEGDSPLTVWLGKDVAGKAISADLSKMPHLLVAGTTGAGKSGCVNAMLSSILLHSTPDDVRLVLVDPKQVELNHYDSVPHLLTPVITSPKQAATALQNLVREMEWRYGVMSVKRTRNLEELNKVRLTEGDEKLPYILCVIDELADLMMVAPADVEDSIIRIAQKARAVGIHLVLATQSPRVDVITGMIKANVPSRIAFSVSSQTDSRVILDQNGAESLLGRGDMLFCPIGSSKLSRIQGAYIDEADIAEITEHWAKQGSPEIREDLLEEIEVTPSKDSKDELDADSDPLLAEAIELVNEMGAASTSGLQRRLRVGYTRAGRLVDMMERRGIVSGFEGSKARQILMSQVDIQRILAGLRGDGSDAGESTAAVSEQLAELESSTETVSITAQESGFVTEVEVADSDPNTTVSSDEFVTSS